MNPYTTSIDAIKDLRKRGYTSELKLEGDQMKCLESGKLYTPDQMRIKEHYRFEGMSNPSDMSIVFGLECEDGTKGVVISSYGTYSDEKLEAFLQKVEMEEDVNT